MNILYIIPNINVAGGISRIVIDKINYLSKTGKFKMFLCYYGSENDKSVYHIGEEVGLHALNVSGKNTILGRVKKVVGATSEIRRLIKYYKIDVVVNANAQYLLWTLPFVCGRIKKVHEFHFSYQGQSLLDKQMFKNPVMRDFLRVFRRFCISRFDRAIVLTPSDKDNWNLRNIEVIPNFTNISFKGIYPTESKTALSIGRLEHQKDFQLMVKAWKIVNQKHPDWHLNIFGEGSMKNELEKLIVDSGLEQTVFLKGNTNDVIQEYSNSSFFVSSSRYEGLPLVLIEAQCCGLPCVGFDITGVSDMIKDNETGILVKERTPEQLALGICKLIENPNLRESMHQNTLLDSEQYTKEYVMSKWISLFEKFNAINGVSNQR